MCVGVQLTIKIREYEYCRLDLAVEQQVGEWGNAGGEVETAFAAKLPGSNHHHITITITTSADLKSLNCSEKIIIWFCLHYDGSNGASHGNVVVSFKFFPHSASSRV